MKAQKSFKNMSIFGPAAGFSRPRLGKRILISLLPLVLLFTTWPQNLSAYQDAPAPAEAAQASQYTQQSPENLQQLVAPIALYPDSLVAQVLAASTYPDQVVEADRWVQAHPDLKGDAWTSSLGDAYYNQQQDVMDAVQEMRQRAQEAGSLKTTPQQTVTSQDSTIIIEPASPEVVYVPAYDPWLVYGGPIEAWPGWYEYPGIWYGDPYLSFGGGYGIGYYGGYGWGWRHWGSDWHNRDVIYDHDRYYSRSRSFYNRNDYYRGGGERGRAGARINEGNRPPNGNTGERGGAGARINEGNRPPNGNTGERGGAGARINEGNRPPNGNTGERGGAGARINEGNRPPNGNTGERGGESNRPGAAARPFEGNSPAARGYGEPRGESGVRSGAFNGYDHGGQTRSFSSRGSTSFGGGAARGGGGSHGASGGHH
jgi:hypothetical protein